MNQAELTMEFFRLYDKTDHTIRYFFAPGRVNLIGDHIDYNGGMVMPVAISLGIKAAVRKRDDRIIRLNSTDRATQIIIDLDKNILFDENAGWGNYPMGVFNRLKTAGIKMMGMDILFHSTLPIGAGLSSSACLEVLTGYIAMKLNDHAIDRLALALLCQEVENNFIGVQCGIMDQFAVAMGKKDHAMYLNASNLDCEHVPFKTGDYKLLIINSNIVRELTESIYNYRQKQCVVALKVVQQSRPIKHLCQATFSEIEELIPDEEIKARARHVVWENQYVLEAKDALEEGDLKAFGECMDASHLSLSNDYEVSSKELDILVDAVRSTEDCIGARMTGAGFGGCIIALVHKDSIASTKEYVGNYYKMYTQNEADFYDCEVVDGVHEIISD